MPSFIRLIDNTLLAADRVGSLRYAPDRRGWLLYDRDGRELGESAPGFDPLDLEPTVIVPAAAGEVATVLYIGEDVEGRPERADVRTARCQIAAWRCFIGEWAAPVLVGEPEGEHSLRMTLVRRPDGRMADPMGASFANLNEATGVFLEEAQKWWDRGEEEVNTDDEIGEPSVH
jgi:hypothetical protein